MSTNRKLIIPRPETAKLGPEEQMPSFEAVWEIAKERAEKLKLLKAAILRHDTDEVYRLAGSLCGLGDDYEARD